MFSYFLCSFNVHFHFRGFLYNVTFCQSYNSCKTPLYMYKALHPLRTWKKNIYRSRLLGMSSWFFCYLPESGSFQQSGQPSQPVYVSQGVHPPAPSSYSVSKSPGKYNPPGQSAFSSYSSHYAQHQQKITEPPFPAAYQIQRMQQPGESKFSN